MASQVVCSTVTVKWLPFIVALPSVMNVTLNRLQGQLQVSQIGIPTCLSIEANAHAHLTVRQTWWSFGAMNKDGQVIKQ